MVVRAETSEKRNWGGGRAEGSERGDDVGGEDWGLL